MRVQPRAASTAPTKLRFALASRYSSSLTRFQDEMSVRGVFGGFPTSVGPEAAATAADWRRYPAKLPTPPVAKVRNNKSSAKERRSDGSNRPDLTAPTKLVGVW